MKKMKKKMIGVLGLFVLVMCLPVVVWAQGLPLKDGSASTLATIQSCGTPNCLSVQTPQVPASTGLTGIVGSTGASGSNSTVGRVNRGYVGEDHGLQVAAKYIYWDDTFNATAQNTAKYKFAATTQTVTQAAGTLNINAAAGNAINTNSGMQTWRTFPIFAKSEVRVNFSGFITQVPQTNNLIEFGLFSADITTRVAPTDGVLFRYNALAEFRGIVNIGGVETQTAAITAPSASVSHDFLIVIQTNTVLFYVDDVLSGTITLLSDIPGSGQPMLAAEQPITMRTYIGGSAPALATVLKISDVFITSLGMDQQKSWGEQKAGFGHMLSQGQNGGTMGSTALLSNSLVPGAGAAMTNTTAALTAGLGGQFSAQPTLTASTDGILQSFQNPAGSITQTPRNLVIKGVWLKGMVTAVLTGGPVLYLYSLAYGHTAVSMATAEGTSFGTNPTTKAPSWIGLGIETYAVGAALGTLGQGMFYQFDTPIIVAPGEFIAICAKNVGTVTTVGVITWLVGYDGYFE